MSNTWIIEYASGESSATAGKTFPVGSDQTRTLAKWFQCIGPGTVVVACEGGQTFTKHATGGEVYKGSFTSLTSTTCTYVVMGNGPPPPAIPANGTAAQATIEDAGGFTSQTTAEGALQELYQNVKSVQCQLNVPSLAAGILAAGTPLAAFADNSSSNPGITLADSKAVAVRWNNNASQTAVWYSVPMPQDLDDTAVVVMHILASKSGATLGDATTFTVTAFYQTVGALHDADADLGGTSSALTGDATAKTVAELTLTLAAADVPASPSNLSFSIKPTNGTLGTDDALVEAIWFEFKGKLLTS